MTDSDAQLYRAQLENEADELAREAGCIDRADAWDRVRAGEFAGTFLVARLSQISFLLGAHP